MGKINYKMMLNKNNAPLNAKIILGIIPVIIIVGGFIYLSVIDNRITKEFYKTTITAVVVSSSDWQKRSINFYLDNGVQLNFLAPAEGKIKIGDSIYKPANTFLYNVYRKDVSGKKNLVSKYDYNEIE